MFAGAGWVGVVRREDGKTTRVFERESPYLVGVQDRIALDEADGIWCWGSQHGAERAFGSAPTLDGAWRAAIEAVEWHSANAIRKRKLLTRKEVRELLFDEGIDPDDMVGG